MYIIGVDEVGRGALAGDVFTAGVLVKVDTAPVPGVGDSKKLSAKQRDSVAAALKAHPDVRWTVARRSVEQIESLGIGKATSLCFIECIERLIQDPPGPIVKTIVDGVPLWNRDWLSVPTEFLPKADSLVWAVGAASILAKVIRDKYMVGLAALHPEYGWASNMGYGTQAHIAALHAHGMTPFHRRKFAATAMAGSLKGSQSGVAPVDIEELFGLEPMKAKEPDPRYDLPDLEDLFGE